MCSVAEILAISLTFLLIAFSSSVGIRCENVKETGLTSNHIRRDQVDLSEHSRSIWNNNANESSPLSARYLAKNPTDNEQRVKLNKADRRRLQQRRRKYSRRQNRRRNRSKYRHSKRRQQAKDIMSDRKRRPVSEPKRQQFTSSNYYGTKPTTKPCSTCGLNAITDAETIKNIRVQALIQTMAEKLRTTPEELRSKNNNQSHLKLPDEILQESQNDSPDRQETDHYYAQTLKTIFEGRDLGSCIPRGTTGCYRFDTQHEIPGREISGQLWFYKTPDRRDHNPQTFLVYSLKKYNNGSIRVESLVKRHNTDVKDGWVTIPIEGLILGKNEDKEVMLAIQCFTCSTRSHRSLFGAKHNYVPLLVVHKTNHPRRETRPKRNADCDPEHECCMSRMRVDLTTLDMPFRPSVINMPYCHGTCHKTEAQAHTKHTEVKQLWMKHRPGHSYLKICCVPVAYLDSTELVNTNDGRVINFPDLIVTQCGCV